jgi:CubicO group peptidase (beta-lactamase class C family)
MRRVTGRSLKEFVRDEIAAPLGADFQIGARPADYGRIAEIIGPPPLELPLDQLPEDSPMRKTFRGGSMVLMCPDRRTTIAYVMNKMGPGILGSERTATYATLIFDALASA